jgi:XTP/dITP diphosphohydrolase
MSNSLLFATGNKKKIEEASAILQKEIKQISQTLLNNTPPEDGNSFEENAKIKANYVFEQTGQPCFAEDSGLCVEALNTAPGIYSARYAGNNANDTENNNLLLKNLEGIPNRRAFFRAVVCYVDATGVYFFEGNVHGHIAEKMSGEMGFGYDPLFIPKGFEQTFAELGKEVKNTMSHRKVALDKFSFFLQNHIPKSME